MKRLALLALLLVASASAAAARAAAGATPVVTAAAVVPRVVAVGAPLPQLRLRVVRRGDLLVYVLACRPRSGSCGGTGRNVALARVRLRRVGVVSIPLRTILRTSLLRPRPTRLRRGTYAVMLGTGSTLRPQFGAELRFRVR